MNTKFSSLESEVKLNEALKGIQFDNRKFTVKDEIKDKLKALLMELYDEKLTLKEDLIMKDDQSSDRLNILQDDRSIINQRINEILFNKI